MDIEMVPPERIRPYENNPRRNDQAVGAVAESIRRFGFRQPIVADGEGVIVVGETRWKAARKLGLAEVPVLFAKDLPPEQARAYRLADNKTGELADWDYEKLLEELKADGGDPAAWLRLGFDEGELEDLLLVPGETSPDHVPEPGEFVTSRAGDLWALGEHRLLCGDSTLAGDVDRLMGDELAAMCATDPPYLVDYTGVRVGDRGKDWSDSYREIDITDAAAFFLATFENVLAHLDEHAAIYCWHAHKRLVELMQAWRALGILDHQQIIWVKPVPVFGSVFWHFRHEPCIMGWRQSSKPRHDGRHAENSVWDADGGEARLEDLSREELLEIAKASLSVWEVDWEGNARPVGNEHPTTKPVELFARPIRKHTRRGDVVYEPFSGSGSQLVAAEMLGRRCRAMELSPPFVDVAVRCWQLFTGREATLEDGRTFAQVRKQRRASERRRASKEAAGA